MEGEGCVARGDPQAAVEGASSFPGSLKSAEISANQESEWVSESSLNRACSWALPYTM